MNVTSRHVSSRCGVCTYDLFKAHPDDFGSPGHFYMHGSETYYTPRGLTALAEEFSRRGNVSAAHALNQLAAESTAVERPNWARQWEEAHQ